ncbi:MAG: DNA-binding response regulator [Rhodothalassiaceae bacterium]|nr:MAG: DNA-binding response regulator [Rhodothalassiaceae bacterium]
MGTLLIVDGFELFRITLRELAERTGLFDAIREAHSSGEMLHQLARAGELAAVVLHPRSLDLSEADGLRLVRRFAPDARVILFRDHAARHHPETIDEAVTVLPRSCSSEDVLAAFARAMPQGRRRIRFLPGAARQLSRRQRQIMAMVAEGLANKEIAHRLGIAEGTVKAHIHAVFRALGVRNRTEAVVRYGTELRRAGAEA